VLRRDERMTHRIRQGRAPQLLRLLFDCHSFDTPWQGTTSYLSGLINALPGAVERRARDLRLELYCAARHEINIRRHVHEPAIWVPAASGFLRRNMWDIPRALRRLDIDIVVSQYVRPFLSPCPTVSVIHDVLFLDNPDLFARGYVATRKILFRWSARTSDCVTTVSTYSATRIATHFGIPQEDIHVIPNGVHSGLFAGAQSRETVSGRPVRLLSVSRLEQRKRHEWGIEAIRTLSSLGISAEYTIVGHGQGRYAKDLRQMVQQAALDGLRVQIKEGLGMQQLAEEYTRADIFICPSAIEGFGIPVAEAIASGLPCVVTDGGALAAFRGRFAGHMSARDDQSSFISGVVDVAQALPHYVTTARHWREDAMQRYGWPHIADSFLDMTMQMQGSER